MKNVRIKCPAKVNLTLEIVNKRDDGFHNIKSIMQTISLYDYLDIKVNESVINKIELSGTSTEIPYNEKNLVYKACQIYLEEANLTGYEINIYIEKNIPVSAGLAGGSTDAAGVLCGLNHIFKKLDEIALNKLCATLGSDLNFCLHGGCMLATSRGEVLEKIADINSKITLIKPKKLGISAKEAYTKYAKKEEKPKFDMTEKMLRAISDNKSIRKFLYNDLEYAVFDDYEELKHIKNTIPESIMSGSGSTFFVLDNIDIDFGEEYQIIKNLEFVSEGVTIIN